jgi:hypothetical protein
MSSFFGYFFTAFFFFISGFCEARDAGKVMVGQQEERARSCMT